MANRAQRLSGINTLAYLGIEPITAPYLVVDNRAPTTDDRVGNQIGAVWVVMAAGNPPNPLTAEVWFLVSLMGTPPGGALWIQLEQSGGGMAIEQIVTDNGTVIPLANSITELGGTSAGGVATNINTYANPNGSQNMVIALNNSISQPNTNIAGTTGMYRLGGATNASRFMFNYGTNNTFLGNASGNLTLTVGNATNNTGIGFQSLSGLTTGTENSCLGSLSGTMISSGSSNTMLNRAGIAVTSGSDNFLAGDGAGVSLTTSSQVIAIGTAAANLLNPSLSTGESSLAIGYHALASATNQVRMIAIGDTAMQFGQGDNSIAIGFEAAQNMGLSTSCVFLGYRAGRNNNSGGVINAGTRNIAIGTSAMSTGITTGNQNICIGFQSGNSLTSGANNFAAGAGSLFSETVASDTVCIGNGAGASAVGGVGQNVIIGSGASPLNLTGAGNCLLGYLTGTNYTGAESNNILIGSQVTGTLGENTTTRIGVEGTQTQCFVAGIRGITTGVADAIAVLIDSAGQLGTVSSSRRFKDNIESMDELSSDVMDLNPVVFTYKEDKTEKMQYGLIAEDVHEVFPDLVVYDDKGLPASVKYHELPVLLLNEIKKLQQRIQDLEDDLN